MAKRLIPKAARELPPSTIYLDDLKEIEEIVRSSLAVEGSTLRFLYAVDDEFIMDSVEELASHGGHARTLDISASSEPSDGPEGMNSGDRILSLCESTSFIHNPYRSRLSPADFKSRILGIFERRARPFMVAFETLPLWLRFIVYMVSCLSLVALNAAALRQFSNSDLLRSQTTRIVFEILWMAIFSAVVWSPFWAVKGRFRINLCYIRSSQLERVNTRREFQGKIMWILIGALLGGLASIAIQLMSNHFTH
jgi:hypothetical protein